MIDFSEHKFRASSCHALATGTIGVSETQEERIKELELRKTTKLKLTDGQQKKYDDYSNRDKLTDTQKKELKSLEVKKNSFLGLTETMEKELKSLIHQKDNPEMPKTMLTELRKIYRSVKYDRHFLFTNKYIKKGISQEEESFTVYQHWLEKVKGIKTFLKNNKQRIEDDFFSGETDCSKPFYDKYKWGFDVKTSWSLETFPFKEDKLDNSYVWQNQVYMHLTGIKEWKTAYVLVNSTESTLHNEKMKYFYSYDMHLSEKNEEKYIETCRDLEKLHIVDYDKFMALYPGQNLEISREEWHKNNFDIPLEDRVVEKVVFYDEEKIKFIQKRIILSRNYLNSI